MMIMITILIKNCESRIIYSFPSFYLLKIIIFHICVCQEMELHNLYVVLLHQHSKC